MALACPTRPAVVVVCMAHGAKRTARALHSALGRDGGQPPVVLGVSVDLITSDDLKPQDVLLNVVAPAVDAILFEQRMGEVKDAVHAKIKKGLRSDDLKADCYELFYASASGYRPAWSAPENGPICSHPTADLRPTNLYMADDGPDDADTLELIEELEDLEEDYFRAEDVNTSAEVKLLLRARVSKGQAKGPRIVHVSGGSDDEGNEGDEDDPSRCRAIALKVCQSFLAEKRFKLIWRVTEPADIDRVAGQCKKSDKLLLWVDVCSTSTSTDGVLSAKLRGFLKEHKSAKVVLTAPSQAPWSAPDAEGYKCLPLPAAAHTAAPSGYHDSLVVTPLDTPGGKPFNPLEKGWSAKEIREFLDGRLTNHNQKLAGAVIDDDGSWVFRLGITDIAQLHRLRQTVLGDDGDAKMAITNAFKQMRSTAPSSSSSLPPSPPPSPPAGTVVDKPSSLCVSAMRALCRICPGTRREDEQRLLEMSTSVCSPEPAVATRGTPEVAHASNAPAIAATPSNGPAGRPEALATAALSDGGAERSDPPAAAGLGGGGDAADESQPTAIYWKVDEAKFAEMYERTIFSLEKLTPHQSKAFRKAQKKLTAADDGSAARGRGVHVQASAGAGKTYIALHTIVSLLTSKRAEAGRAPILFVAPSDSLAIFVFKWIYYRLRQRTDQRTAKRKLCEQQALLALVKPFHEGPLALQCDFDRQTLALEPCAEAPTAYRLLVMDEAHHLLVDAALHQRLEPVMTSAAQLMLLSDISQARTQPLPGLLPLP